MGTNEDILQEINKRILDRLDTITQAHDGINKMVDILDTIVKKTTSNNPEDRSRLDRLQKASKELRELLPPESFMKHLQEEIAIRKIRIKIREGEKRHEIKSN